MRKRKPRSMLTKTRFDMEALEARVLLSGSNVNLSIFATPAQGISGSPTGLSPSMIEQAYDLKNIVYTVGGQPTSANGAGETIAIVDSYGDPDISSDLETFDANFGLTNDNNSGQFVLTVATPFGGVSTNAGWATEESLDVEWAHAIAPEANILLVEVPNTTITSLTSGVVWAAEQSGVVAVSMSWGDSPEFSGETAYDSDFLTPTGHEGVTFVAASGDDGVTNYPSTSPNVLAVGGTTLNVDDAGDWLSESPWVDSGGGHSPYEGTNKPDVAYAGDPDTGFLIYDSLPYQGSVGWEVVGGTSAGTPQWAAIVALVDQGRSLLGEGSLDGHSQTIPDLYNLPASDYNVITGTGNTGLGSPIGEKLISGLVGGNITSGGSSTPAPTSTQLAFVQEPSTVTAGTPITPAITVDVEDINGNLVTTDDSTVTISVASGPGSATGTLTVSAVNGVATFNDVVLDTAGTYTLEATDGSLTAATSSSFTINPPTSAPAAQLAFLQEPTNSTAGSTISPSVTVEVEDASGNVVTTDDSDVTLSLLGGSGTLSGTITVAAVNGVATFSNLSVSSAGTYTLEATDASLASASSTAFTVTKPGASQLVIAQSPATAWSLAPISSPIQVYIEDAHGNLFTVGSDLVTLDITSDTPGAVPPSPVTVTAVNGIATFSGITFADAGTFTLHATDGSIVSGSVNVQVIAPPIQAFSLSGWPLSENSIKLQERRMAAWLSQSSSPAVAADMPSSQSASAPTASTATASAPAASPSPGVFQSTTAAVDQSLLSDADSTSGGVTFATSPFAANDPILSLLSDPSDLLGD